jgi:hypothetical protein
MTDDERIAADAMNMLRDSVAKVEAILNTVPEGPAVRECVQTLLDVFEAIDWPRVRLLAQQYMQVRLAVKNAHDIDAYIAMVEGISKAMQK